MVRQNERLHWRLSLRRAVAFSLGLILLLISLPTAKAAGAAGASLSVSPISGTYEVGGTLDVSFLVDTGGQSINAVQADIVFPADKLQVVNPVASTSFISIWVTAPTFSNTDGTIHFQGGLPNPGIKTSGGVVSTVTFRVKSAGTAIIKFSPTSQVLKNDGQGTNILTSTSAGQFTLKTPPPAGPIVSSPTNPDSNQWYSNPEVQLSWEPVDAAVGYSYTFDQNTKATPDQTIDTTKTEINIKATGDGVWYFHIRALTASWGGTTTYPIQIDATPPAAFTPKLDQTSIAAQESATLRFLTSDGASGIDHYEVRQLVLGAAAGASTLFIESTSPYLVNPLPAGNYQFQVRAIDRAGNSTDGSVKLTVTKSALPFFARVPLLNNPIIANSAIIGLAILLFALALMMILRRFRVRATFQHDLEALEKDAKRKAAQLQRELDQLQLAQTSVQQNITTLTPPPAPQPTVPAPPPTLPEPPPAPSL